MTITYNHLNLPRLFTWTSGSFNGNSIEILYDAAGTKLKKTVKTGATVNYTQEYIGGIEYRDGVREAIYHAEGRVKYTSPSTTRYEYTIKDHLGNARISFSDLNGNGVVNVTNVASTNEVLQENHYYPFGLNMDGKWMNDAALDNKYQYNGKEWNDDFGLNLNDYGARWYDGSVGRWCSVDPLAEDFTAWSPYNYAVNNPVSFTDPDGMSATNEYVKDFRTGEVKQVGTKGGDETDYVYSGVINDDGTTAHSEKDPEVLTVKTEKSQGEARGLIYRAPGVNIVGGMADPAMESVDSPVEMMINAPKTTFTLAAGLSFKGMAFGLKALGTASIISGSIKVSKKAFGLRVGLGGSTKAFLSTTIAYKLGLRGSLRMKVPTFFGPKASTLETAIGRNAIPIGGALIGAGYLLEKLQNE